MERKTFLKKGLLGAGMLVGGHTVFTQDKASDNFSLEEIREFVFAAHKDFEKVKKIITEKPLILNCANQSRKGDFETAMGGASHMGRKDIADLLVERGARLDIFNHTFLGHIDLVKTMIKDYPQYLTSYGPHGFTLLHHAKAGKHEYFAKWLIDQGLTESHFKDVFK
ncbi:MAG: hypothetical protein AAFR87_00715 [Bacteroidota bacterium]